MLQIWPGRVRYAADDDYARYLMIRFRLGGRRFILCEPRSRQAYRWMHDNMCEGGRQTGQAFRAPWVCQRSVVV